MCRDRKTPTLRYPKASVFASTLVLDKHGSLVTTRQWTSSSNSPPRPALLFPRCLSGLPSTGSLANEPSEFDRCNGSFVGHSASAGAHDRSLLQRLSKNSVGL